MPYVFKKILFYSLLLLLFSCKSSTTQIKDPLWSTDLATISNNLTSLVACEHINLQGTETKTSSDSVSVLTIEIINGKNIPIDEGKRNELGREIAQQLKKSLANPNEYDKYKVLFVTDESKGAIKESTYTGHIYKNKELQ